MGAATFDAILLSWPFEPWVVVSLLLASLTYARGWRVLHGRDPARWQGSQLIAFLSGIRTLFLALASPLETFAPLLLQSHMAQHVLLIMVAPPLLWLGSPFFPL